MEYGTRQITYLYETLALSNCYTLEEARQRSARAAPDVGDSTYNTRTILARRVPTRPCPPALESNPVIWAHIHPTAVHVRRDGPHRGKTRRHSF